MMIHNSNEKNIPQTSLKTHYVCVCFSKKKKKKCLAFSIVILTKGFFIPIFLKILRAVCWEISSIVV